MSIGATLSEFTALYRNRLIASDALVTFCQDNYGKDPTFQVGFSEKNPPGLAISPFVLIIPLENNPGLIEAEFRWDVDIVWGIDDNRFDDFNNIGVQEMRGVYKLDEMGQIILEVINGIAGNFNIIPDFNQYTLENSEFFPLHVGTMKITSSISNVMGATIGIGGSTSPIELAMLVTEAGDELVTDEGDFLVVAA